MASRRHATESGRAPTFAVRSRADSELEDTSSEEPEEADDDTRPRHLPVASLSSRQGQFVPAVPENYTTGSPATTNTQRRSPAAGANVPPTGNGQQVSDPTTRLSALLTKFIQLDEAQVESCITFCKVNPSIWQQDFRGLPALARGYLHQNDVSGARRAIQRFLLLNVSSQGIKENDKKQKRLESLIRDPSKLGKLVTQRLEQLRTEQPFQPSAALPAHAAPTAPTSSRHGTTAQTRPQTNLAISSTEPQSSFPPLREPRLPLRPGLELSATENIRPRSEGSRRDTFSSGEAPDLDTITNLGGEALLGLPGPASVVVHAWAKDVREQLNKDYKVHEGAKTIDIVFGIGSMIAVFWHENLGSSLSRKFERAPQQPQLANPGKGFVTTGPRGEKIYSNVRRFIIVSQRAGFSVAIPITTYPKNGLTEKKMDYREQMAHAIVYSVGKSPLKLKEEPTFEKKAICVKMNNMNEPLYASSRLYYAKPHSIGHNIKVRHLGCVIPQHTAELMSAFRKEF